eukprot:Seg1329.10 transcript_id=Seg1329.10/GoldUCD/mRNA.D3Y31 product="hypothetical protein" protein_id=Seg1329.10/GoldUCD/D3Y31
MVADQSEAKFRMTPSLMKPIGSAYRRYYLVLAFLNIAVCIGLVVCASILKDFDSNLKDQLFHIWVAIPILFPALAGVAVFISKQRRMVVLFLILALIVMVLCASASMLTGLRYWLDGWHHTRERLDTAGKCSVKNNVCTCTGVSKMPLSLNNCKDVEMAANVLVGEIVLSALGMIFNIAGCFLGFMTICCGPWKFLDDYSREHDHDAGKGVQFTVSQSRPSGNANRGFSQD